MPRSTAAASITPGRVFTVRVSAGRTVASAPPVRSLGHQSGLEHVVGAQPHVRRRNATLRISSPTPIRRQGRRDFHHHHGVTKPPAPESAADPSPLPPERLFTSRRAVERRHEAEQQRGQYRNAERERQHRCISSITGQGRMTPSASPRRAIATRPTPGRSRAAAAAASTRLSTITEPDEPGAAGPQRHAQRELFFTHRRPREHQVRDVAAGDRQKQSHCRRRRVERSAESATLRVRAACLLRRQR